MTQTTSAFESKTCSRCGGSGRYSFNQMDGDRCYGCNGRGWQYTKRGEKAADMYDASLKVAAATLQVGDSIRADGERKFRRITEIRPDATPGSFWLVTDGLTLGARGTSMVRRGQTNEFKLARLAEALAYQETLTKSGQPRKTAAKGAAA